VLAGLREITNFVINSVTYSLNKNEEDIAKNISDVRERIDAGSKL